MILTNVPLIETITLAISKLILGKHPHCMLTQVLLYRMKFLLINSTLHIMNHTGQVTTIHTSIDHQIRNTIDDLKVVIILTWLLHQSRTMLIRCTGKLPYSVTPDPVTTLL